MSMLKQVVSSIGVFCAVFLVTSCGGSSRNKLVGEDYDSLIGTYKVTSGSTEYTSSETYFLFNNDKESGPTIIFLQKIADKVKFLPAPVYGAGFTSENDTIQILDVGVAGVKIDDALLDETTARASRINRLAGKLQTTLRSKNIAVMLLVGNEVDYTNQQELALQLLVDNAEDTASYVDLKKLTAIWIEGGAIPTGEKETYFFVNTSGDRVLVVPELVEMSGREADFLARLRGDGFINQ